MTDVLWNAPYRGGPLDAFIRVPGSKSLTARWMVLAAIASTPAVLIEPLSSRDTRIMRDALGLLGARMEASDHRIRATRPIGGSGDVKIHAGLAGTVMRFIPPLAALHDGDVEITGDPSALVRPMGPIVQALRDLGVDVTEHGEPGRLPITVHGTGRLPGGTVEVDASTSSQFVSALLLAGARADEDLVIRHIGDTLPSIPHIEMTLAVLKRAGVDAASTPDDDGTPVWTVQPGPVDLGELVIEPDLSNAGPFLAAAMVAGGTVAIADWPRTTTQPGAMYRDLLAQMGGKVEQFDDELAVTGTGAIHGIDAVMSDCGELTPTIAALAALADSPSRLRGIGHLRGHETDRVRALATELSKVGADVVEHADSLEIRPGPPRPAVIETYEDHRMATAGAILGLGIDGIQVVDIQTTRKTIPDFEGMWLSMMHTDSPAGQTW